MRISDWSSDVCSSDLAVLFKKFAGIDVFDIEVQESDPARLVEVVAALEPTFGGINLEDIKAPECFEVESKLRERMNRSEERREGKECVSKGRTRGSPYH